MDTNRNKTKERIILVIVWILALALFTTSIMVFFTTEPVTVHFISIGHGDACLVRAGDNGNVLIDSGDVGSGETLLNYFSLHNVRHLDAVFISHFHEDHISGILELLDADFPIHHVYISQHPSNTEAEDTLLRITKKHAIPLSRMQESDSLNLGDVSYQVISQEPFEDDEHLNNMSMILRMEYQNTSFLFTGDIEEDASKRLVDSQKEGLDVDVLKVPHHGGSSSASYELFSAASPTYSIISLGLDNSYGMPSDETLAYLLRTKTKIYRTDRDGTIVMTLGKNKIKSISYSKKVR